MKEYVVRAAFVGLLLLSNFAASGAERRTALQRQIAPKDVERIDIVISYSELSRYRVTAPVPIREILSGLQEYAPEYVPPEKEILWGRETKLVIVTKDREIEVPLGTTSGSAVEWIGEPRVAPSKNLATLLFIILLRGLNVRDTPSSLSSDEELIGGFRISEIQFVDKAIEPNPELSFLILDAIVDGYASKPELTDVEKRKWILAATFYTHVRGVESYVDEVSSRISGFAELHANDTHISPEFGGIPYNARVAISTTSALGRLYKKAEMWQKAADMHQKLGALITPGLLAMATKGSSDPLIREKETVMQHYEEVLIRLKSYVPEARARSLEKLSAEMEAVENSK